MESWVCIYIGKANINIKRLCWSFPGHHCWGVGFPGKPGLLVHREATGCRVLCPNPRGAGCKSGTRLLGKALWVVLAPLSQWEFCICCLVTNNAKESARHGTAGAALGKGLQTAPKQPLGEDLPWNQHPQDVSSLVLALSAGTNHSQRETAQVISQWPQPGGQELHELLQEICLSSSPSNCKRAGLC